ncbi:MAG: serine/threonine-protein phosphatase [Treponema sp.]|nr:serine/threonine-protein phosphatase [Treponema sp.]
MAVVEAISFFLVLIFRKIKVLRHSNFPIIFSFATLEFLGYLIFAYGENPFNSLIIFVCLATIDPLIFAIEPLYYIIVMVVMALLMGPKFVELYGVNSASNAFVYLIIMISLAMSRWFYILRNNVHEHKIKERERQIQQELEMAAVVQKSFYQHDLAGVKNWEIAYFNDPMISLSGDLFDFFVRQNTLSGLCIFDVSGHGLASGLVTMMVKNTMEEEFYENEDVELDFTMQRINERVRAEKGNIENYLTGIILRFTDENIEMVNAGHPNPIIYHVASGLCEYFNCDIKDRQGAIGLGDLDFDFRTLEVGLEENDRIILYTDGITEAKDILNNDYGKERFLESVQRHSNLNVQDQTAAIVDDINQFIGTAPRTDDISIVILQKK